MQKSLIVAVLALTLAWAAPAKADNITFSPSGAPSGNITIDSFDPTTGNSIALGANALTAVGTQVTALFQANLGTAKFGGSSVFTNGDNGEYFTFVAGFNEKLIANSGGLFPSLVLQFDPTGTTNFFDIYANNTLANDLSGTCFTCGTQIMSGMLIATPDVPGYSTFTVLSPNAGALDQANINNDGNNYPGINTLGGQGAFSVEIKVNSANPNYFPGLLAGSTFLFATSEEDLPYRTVDPSACFSNDGTTSCNQPGATVASVGTVNGLNGPNTMFQTDASLAIQTPSSPVPEPATLTLLGTGLLAAYSRRRKAVRG